MLPKENSGFVKKLIAWISTADLLSGAAFAYTGLAGMSEAEYMNNQPLCFATGPGAAGIARRVRLGEAHALTL